MKKLTSILLLIAMLLSLSACSFDKSYESGYTEGYAAAEDEIVQIATRAVDERVAQLDFQALADSALKLSAANLSPSPAVVEQTLAPSPSPSPSPSPTSSAVSVAAYIDARHLYLRSAAYADAPILGEYAKYDCLSITGEEGDWYAVTIQGHDGFMHKDYIIKGNPPPNQSVSANRSSTAQSTKTASPAIQLERAASTERTVYITETGSKYHRSGCRYLSKSKIAIDLSSAKAQGYSPCSVCDP